MTRGSRGVLILLAAMTGAVAGGALTLVLTTPKTPVGAAGPVAAPADATLAGAPGGLSGPETVGPGARGSAESTPGEASDVAPADPWTQPTSEVFDGGSAEPSTPPLGDLGVPSAGDPSPATSGSSTADATATARPTPPSDARLPNPDGPAAGAPPETLLAWTSGGLPDELTDAISSDLAVFGHTVVQSRPTGLIEVVAADGQTVQALTDGWYIPLDVIAVDPDMYPIWAMGSDQKTLVDLRPGQALLSRSSAAVRGVDVGARLTLVGGGQVTVAGVVEDVQVAGAEVVVHTDDAAALGVDQPAYVLMVYNGPRSHLQQRLTAAVPDRTPVRFRSRAETTWLRHGDAVQPQVLLKATLGEFAVRPLSGRDIDVDDDWEAANIVTQEVPILGSVRCHRLLVPRLVAAMEELEQANLAPLVDPANFAGCYAPRLIAPGAAVSRHSWGGAVDLNVGTNPRGSFTTQDPRLVEVMQRHGFAWGGTWLVPDPAHYELVDTDEPVG